MPSSNLPGHKQVTPLAKYAGINLGGPFPNTMQNNLSNWRMSNMVVTCLCLALPNNFPRDSVPLETQPLGTTCRTTIKELKTCWRALRRAVVVSFLLKLSRHLPIGIKQQLKNLPRGPHEQHLQPPVLLFEFGSNKSADRTSFLALTIMCAGMLCVIGACTHSMTCASGWPKRLIAQELFWHVHVVAKNHMSMPLP